MAVTVIVEDGSGHADANSYASVTQADAYFATRPRSTLWSPLTTEQKAQFLVHATRILDSSVLWDGEKYVETQALAFPRYPDDLESSEVPGAIIIALYELAYALVGTDLTGGATTAAFNKVKVGPIEVQTDTPAAPAIIPRFVRDLVAPWGTAKGAGGNAALTRV